uniref:Peptidase M41 domain-containing protein n=1 Tax=Thermoanaerobaculum aquaticum TaxID=1312852 RepID=A0A7C2NDW1_9BACT
MVVAVMDESKFLARLKERLPADKWPLVEEAYRRAQELVQKHRPVLDRIAEALLEREVLEGEEVYQLVSEFTGVPVEKLKGPGRPTPAVAAVSS